MKILIDFIALFLFYILFFYKHWIRKGKDYWLVSTLIYIYISFVLYFTLMPILCSLPFLFHHPYHSMNLIPFIDVLEGRGDYLRQIILNIIMMIPFGFLTPLLLNRSKFIKTVVACFLFSLCIELLQPLMNGFRASDITDLLTNVLGSIIGYGLYLLFYPVIMPILKRMRK